MGSDLLSLPLAQRLEFVQTQWDSIAAEPQGVAATAEEQRLVAERILIRQEAREDLRDASTWYADQDPGIGNRFLAAIREQFWIRCAPCTYKAARIERQTYPAPSIKQRLTNREVIALSRKL